MLRWLLLTGVLLSYSWAHPLSTAKGWLAFLSGLTALAGALALSPRRLGGPGVAGNGSLPGIHGALPPITLTGSASSSC